MIKRLSSDWPSALDAVGLYHTADAIRNCGRWPYRWPCRRFRFCARCAAAQAATWTRRFTSEPMTFHLTLTTRSEPTLCRQRVNDVRSRLRRFFRARRIRRHIKGGVYRVEVKLGPTGLWSIHAHAVVVAPFPPSKSLLRREWHRRTGAFMVAFDSIRQGALAQVLAYDGKEVGVPSEPDLSSAVASISQRLDLPASPRRVRELLDATRKIILVQAFGTCHWRRRRTLPPQCPNGRSRSANDSDAPVALPFVAGGPSDLPVIQS